MGSFGVVKIDGESVVLSSFDAMYVRAQQNGDKKLMQILEHRDKEHSQGPCHCEIMPGDTI